MNDNDDPPHKEFDLPPHGHRFIDLIQHRPESNWPFYIWHITKGIPFDVSAQRYRFAISAYTENTPSVSRHFEMFKDGSVEWKMKAIGLSASSGE